MTAPVGALAGFWSRLNPRERSLLALLVVVFFAMGMLVLWMMRRDAFTAADERIADLRAGIQLMRSEGTAYQEKVKEKSEREAMIASDPIAFLILLEEATKAVLADKSTRQEEEKPPVAIEGGLRKRVMSFELRGVTLEELIKYLHYIEGQPGRVILTERLRVRSPSAVEDRLNVEIDLATWEIAAAGAGEGAP